MAFLQLIFFLCLVGGAASQSNSKPVLSSSSLSRVVVSRSTGDVFLTNQCTGCIAWTPYRAHWTPYRMHCTSYRMHCTPYRTHCTSTGYTGPPTYRAHWDPCSNVDSDCLNSQIITSTTSPGTVLLNYRLYSWGCAWQVGLQGRPTSISNSNNRFEYG